MKPALPALACCLLATLLTTIAAFVIAVYLVLGGPLSRANLEYAIWDGAIWGAAGSVFWGIIWSAFSPAYRTVGTALCGALVWSVVSGFGFLVHVAAGASC